MKNENQEIVRPEIPLELEAVGALAKLAGGILSSGDLLELTTMPVRSHATAPNTIAQARYQILIDQLPAATFMAWFENGRCELYVSSHIETLLGYTATEWIENPILWYERLHPDDRERWNEEFSRTISCAASFKGDYRFLAKDGRLVWIHGEAKVLRDESGRPFMHGIGYDITELKCILEDLRQARDKEQRANRAKSEFLSRTSHELRTPLNGIIGFAEFLIDGKAGPLNSKQKEYLQDIYNSGQHLLRLIDDVLDLAKIEAGKIGLRSESFSVRQAVESVCAGIAPVARKHNIRLNVLVSPALQEVILDQQKFKQILYNLLSNAIKFTQQGGEVYICAETYDAHRFKLVVRDTGIGIKSEDMPRLFQEFEQLESRNTRRYEGTGLGLALTKRFVELQGGTISVDSEFDRGSTFSVVLPYQIWGIGS